MQDIQHIEPKKVYINRDELIEIEAIEHDVKTRFIDFKFISINKVLDISHSLVEIYALTQKGNEIFNNLNIIDGAKGLARLELTDSLLVPGTTQYVLKIRTETGGILSSNKFNLIVHPDLMTGNAIEGTNEYTALDEALKTVGELNSMQVDIKTNKNNISNIQNKINNLTLINVRDFGAKGDGKTDDTQAIENALNSTGGGWTSQSVVLYFPTGNYKITKPICINRDILTIKGDGIDNTIFSPVGIFDFIQGNGTKGSERYSIKLRGFSINGTNLTGKGINWSHFGLNCGISDVYIENVKGQGLYISSSFDHTIERITVRGCKNEGVFIDQKQSPFEELSYLTLNNIVAVACDNGGRQWVINGGNNLYINECKANEGLIGIDFIGETWSVHINNFYMDGLHNVDSTVFQINNEKIVDMTINNVYAWNCVDIVHIQKCKSITLGNLARNPYNSEARDRYDILIDDTFEGNCFIDNKPYNIMNNSQQVLNYNLATNHPNVVLENLVLTKTFFKGYRVLTFEYPSSKKITGVVANIKGNGFLQTNNGIMMPAVSTDWTEGYFKVELSLPPDLVCDVTKDLSISIMFMYNHRKE